MKRYALLIVVVALIATACTSPKFEDLTTVGSESSSQVQADVRDPDSVTIYRNVDLFPNVLVMCINGDALISRSKSYSDWQLIYLQAGEHNLCG